MATYQFKRIQKVNATIDELWDFISSPENLKEITPDYMGFDITTNHLSKKMYPGMIIGYKVSPLFKIRTNWLTEITQVKEKDFFVDEQRHGPYKMWHHQHHLIPIENGVLMHDIVTYIPPMGVFGLFANKFFIRKKLKEIFDFRESKIDLIFGPYNSGRTALIRNIV